MKKFFKISFITLSIAVLAFLSYVATESGNYFLAREIAINAPAGVIFAEINDLHAFNAWNPWAKMDPETQQSYEGPSAGVGAAYLWSSRRTGSGKMTISESLPLSYVKMDLEFYKPFAGRSLAEFKIRREGERSLVTWINRGQNSFIPRIITHILSMDRMMGDAFESGLADLKRISEAKASAN